MRVAPAPPHRALARRSRSHGCRRRHVILVCAGGSRTRTRTVQGPPRLGLGGGNGFQPRIAPTTRTRPTPDPPHAPNVCARARRVGSRFDLGRTYRTRRPSGRLSCSRGGCLARAPCGGAPTTRAGTRWAQSALRSPLVAVTHPDHECPCVPCPLVRRWVRWGVCHAVRGTRTWSTHLTCAQGPCVARGSGR